MKKIRNILLILIICCFNINVLAENNSKVDVKKEEPSQEVSTTKSNIATLEEVYINEEKIVCDEKYVCEKVIKDNSINKVVITYKKTDSKSSVSKEKIESELKNGINEYKVEVIAEDQTTKNEYTFKITKETLSTDSSLKKLVINDEEIILKNGTLKYQTDVSYSTNKLEIEAIPNHNKATVVDFKDNKISYDFFDLKKEIKIKVESEAGDLSTYVITISKRKEADTSLKSLKISNVSLDFESGVFDYEIKVLKNVDVLEIDAVPNDSKAEVEIDQPKKLEIGENLVKITVNNDGNSKTYQIKVNKLDEEDQSLANLKSLEIEGYELNFKENIYEYDLKIVDVNFLKINALPKIEDAIVEITGNLDLVDGSIIKIKVIYDSENYNVYKINIIKDEVLEKENNFLMYLIIICSIIIVIAVVIIIIIIKKKNKNNKNNKSKKSKKSDKDNLDKKEIKEEKDVSNKDIISISSDEEIEDII